MPRGREDHQLFAAEAQHVAIPHEHVRALRTRGFGEHDATAEPLAGEPRARHVVGVDVGLQRVQEPQAELANERCVAHVLLVHRVDEHRLTACFVGEQISVRRGAEVEELPEEHALRG